MLNEAGRPYTTRESEVTDLTQLARTLFEAPANFIEQYFAPAILDGVGDPGSFPDLRYDGVAKRPALLIQAGDSDSNSAADDGEALVKSPPNAQPGSRTVVLPGYNHIDVVSAARSRTTAARNPAAPSCRGSCSPSRVRPRCGCA